MALSHDEIKRELLAMKVEDVTATFMNNTFAHKASKDAKGKLVVNPPRIHVETKLNLAKGEYYNNDNITTTVGRFIYNKVILEKDFIKYTGYINETLTSGKIKEIEGKLLTYVLDGKVPVDAFHRYLSSIEWLGLQFNSIIGSSFSPNTIKPVPAAMELKEELLKANREELEKGNVLVAVDIENKVLAKAKEELKGDPGMDMYDSGARGSFNSSYKPMFSMTGPVYNKNEQRWDIVESNLNDGIRKEDMLAYGNSVVAGAYPKAIGTSKAGYMSKELTSGFQDVVLDPPGTDCGSKGTISIYGSPFNLEQCVYSYAMVNGKPVLITRGNMNQFLGKTIHMRTPIFCKSEKLCPICAGAIFQKLGIENVGLTVARVSSTILNLSMKKFHSSNVKSTKLTWEKLEI